MSLAFAPTPTRNPAARSSTARTTAARTAPSLPAVPVRSIAQSPRPERAAELVARSATPEAQPVAAPARTGAPRVRAVPEGTEARGFVLYVGIDEGKAAADGTTLHRIVEALRALTAEISPSAETYAAVALAPEGAGGRDVDVVRLALQDPAALAKQREGQTTDDADRHPNGVIIDISRKRVLLDGDAAGLTYKEFELLQYLVLREGRTIDRHELIENLWDADDEAPSERTIDVHVRRLRSKLAQYQDIVRTVRGLGYRFDRHADVSIRQASTPSPDVY
ncbi:MAG TPA: winged helix-turn-helix domain-containing protein [Agromyces sp.]|nr:winged helix-turn-helix domain-containing protein [Agromyces sp.]